MTYYETYPDVRESGLDAWWHYTVYGRSEGRLWPGQEYEWPDMQSREGYLSCYQDVRNANVDPWWHFCHHGRREGRAWPTFSLEDKPA